MDCERGGEYYGLPIFEYDELRIATNNFDPEREVGDGGFGTVFYGNISRLCSFNHTRHSKHKQPILNIQLEHVS